MEVQSICNALGNKTRYKIIRALKKKSITTCCGKIEYYENGASVGDVVKVMGLAQSTISQHLLVLEKAGLIYKEKRGSWTCFFLNKKLISNFLKNICDELG